MAVNRRLLKKANHGKRPCSGHYSRAKKRITTPR